MSHTTASDTDRTQTAYEPPRIEQVLTDEALAREVHYAGTQSGDLSDDNVGA